MNGDVPNEARSFCGDGLVRQLVCRLAGVAGTQYAFATGPLEALLRRRRRFGLWLAFESGTRFRFRAVSPVGFALKRLSQADYPCLVERVLGQQTHRCELPVGSCLIVPLLGFTGRPLGHLGAIDPGLIGSGTEVERLLALLAPRAALEIQRLALAGAYERAERRSPTPLPLQRVRLDGRCRGEMGG